MVKNIFYFPVLFLLFIQSKHLLAQKDSSLRLKIERLLKDEGLTGAVWSIVDSLGNFEVDAVGVSNYETGKVLRPTHKVQVGSITKTLIAVAILRLATEKKINLNDPVKKYLPTFTIINEWERQSPITIRHLLDHTSGLSDLRLWHFLTKRASADLSLGAAFKNGLENLKVHAKPGSFFSYSNMGYTILGMVIEAITKEQYEKYLDKNLLEQLGMKNSSFKFMTQSGIMADTMMAWGHFDDKTPYSAKPVYLRPAAQFTTTAYDMAIFSKFLLSDGYINGKVFIETSLLKQLGVPVNTIGKENGLEYGYALGARSRDRYGYVALMHSGNIAGFSAMLYCFPDSKQAFFIAHNMDSETAIYERFYEAIIKHIKPVKISRPYRKVALSKLTEWDGYYVPLIPAVEPLSYFAFMTGFIKITTCNEFVMWSPFQKETIKLSRVSDNLFIADGRQKASHLFYQDTIGNRLVIDAVSSRIKVSNLYMYGNWVSSIAGCVGLLYILFYGFVSVIKRKRAFFKMPAFSAVSGLVVFAISLLFLLSQSFMSLGDITLGTVLLYISTFILPLGLVYACFQYLRSGIVGWAPKLHFTAILLTLQWMVVLFKWELIPFRLWI